MRRGVVGFAFLFALLAGLLAPVRGFAAPLPIDNSPQFRDTVQGPDGLLHTVWLAQNGRTSSLVYQVNDPAGRTLAGPLVIVDSTARIRRPQLAIDGRRIVHFLWQERAAHDASQATAIRYATLTLAPAGSAPRLSPPVTINQDPTATHPSLAVDQAGWAYAAWEIEGLAVKLAAIAPSGRVSQLRHITREATKTDHALPTVAVDRRGDVHVVWSSQSGGRTQLIYKAFRGHGGQGLGKEKIIYAANGDINQTKVMTFDAHGALKVSWVNSPGRRAGQRSGLYAQSTQSNRPASSGATVGGGSLLLRRDHSGAGSVVAVVVDQSLTALPGPVWSAAGEAVTTPKPRLDAPAAGRVSSIPDAPPPGTPSPADGDDAVSKLLMNRVLRYATWSAAPPSVREATTARLLLLDASARSTRSRFIHVALSTDFPFGSDQIDLFAYQHILFAQGGDTIS